MEVLRKFWKYIDHNRFSVIWPVAAMILWIVAIGCTPQTASPLDANKMVNVKELAIEFKTWQGRQEIMSAKFEAAGQDIKDQAEANEKISQLIVNLASGSVADLPGLLTLLLGGGMLGAITDNIRKRGLIAGLKRNA